MVRRVDGKGVADPIEAGQELSKAESPGEQRRVSDRLLSRELAIKQDDQNRETEK